MNNQEELNSLVSVHLGKAGDGTVVKPYVTPDEVDPSLLVSVPRSLNRTQYDLKEEELPFEGMDAWNAYEFSTLLKNGFPISGWLKFVYSSNSPNIVESKSVKLYLNSYNMARIISTREEIVNIIDNIAADLEKAVGVQVGVSFSFSDVTLTNPMRGEYFKLEDYCNVEALEFTEYNESSDILEVVDTDDNHFNRWQSSSLRSNCRVTNQPDWGDVFIHIRGKKTITPDSLLKYIVSMRKENHFHEEICECIYKRLYDLCNPDELLVTCLYTRRGGIDINPVRASSIDLLFGLTAVPHHSVFCTKTHRQ